MISKLMAGWADDRKPNGSSLLGFMLFSPSYALNEKAAGLAASIQASFAELFE
jgi:hypothetical protein